MEYLTAAGDHTLSPALRRRRHVRPLNVFAALPGDRTAAAMDDAAEAQQLIDDLLALVEAGMVVPIDDCGQARYAPAEPVGSWPFEAA